MDIPFGGWLGESGSSGSIGGGRSGGLSGGNIVLVLLIVLIIILRSKRKGRSSTRHSSDYVSSTATSHSSNRQVRYNVDDKAETKGAELNLDPLLARDSGFFKEAFLARCANVFVTLQNAWTAKDWKSIRAFEANQLYSTHETQLQQYIDHGKTNVVKDIAVLSSEIEEYTEDAQGQHMSVILQARYRDYVIDDKTGAFVKGNKSNLYLMTYRMTFMREPDATTGSLQWVLEALQPLQQRQL